MSKEPYSYGKRDLLHAQKRPTDILAYLRYAVCTSVKRGLIFAQKRPIHMAKEACYHTNLRQVRQKRLKSPNNVSRETSYNNIDLLL